MEKTKDTSKKHKTPWPTKDAMDQIYSMNLWGGGNSEFYSGEGSHSEEIVNPYLKVVENFMTSFDSPLSVCDLGCGDFNIGKDLVKFTKKYLAIDIVAALIERNRKKYKVENLEFLCLDIAKDELPTADCAILRQVLQHLSNAEVKKIVAKLQFFKYVVITEHLPDVDFEPNHDIISGQGIRLKKNSGINLLATPFNLQVKEAKELLSLKLNNSKGLLVTTCYTMF